MAEQNASGSRDDRGHTTGLREAEASELTREADVRETLGGMRRRCDAQNKTVLKGDAKDCNMSESQSSGDSQVAEMSEPKLSENAQVGNMIEPQSSDNIQVGEMDDPPPSEDVEVDNIVEPQWSGDAQVYNKNDPQSSGYSKVDNMDRPQSSGDAQVDNMDDPLSPGDAKVDNMDDIQSSGDGQVDNMDDPQSSGDAQVDNMDDPQSSGDAQVDNMDDPQSSANAQVDNIDNPPPSGDALNSHMENSVPTNEHDIPFRFQEMHIHTCEKHSGVHPEDTSEMNMKLLVSSSASPNSINSSFLPSDVNTNVPNVALSVGNVASNQSGAQTADSNDEKNLTVICGGATVSEVEIRDSRSSSGYREADDAYNRFFEEYFPNFKEGIFKVPQVNFGKEPYNVKSKNDIQLSLGETAPVYLYHKDESAIAGENAEKRVADFIERKLRKDFQNNKCPAFIIMSYQFEQFCNKTGVSPVQDENKYVDDKKDPGVSKQKVLDGEHDLLIVHYKYGIIFIQVKSTQTATNPNNTTKEAIKQTEIDKEFFKANFKDLERLVTSVVALPDINRRDLDENRLYKDCKTRLCDFGLSHCLFKNELVNETDGDLWWSNLSNLTKNKVGFDSFADYKRVLAKYVGYKSTVPIPVVNHNISLNEGSSDGRRFSDCVSAMGNRYMNIVLTPEQVYILSHSLPRLVIHGQFGSGKTVLLILKVRSLLRQMEKVCVITVCTSPLVHILKESITHDMNQAQIKGIEVKQARDQEELSRILKECGKLLFHVFIDEFPSFTRKNDDLQATIKHYPKKLMLWSIMSRERNITLSRPVNEIFEPKAYDEQSQTTVYTRVSASEANSRTTGSRDKHGDSQGFIYIHLSKMLRCPPTVHSLLPMTDQKQEKLIAPYSSDKNITSPGTQKRLASHFHSIGLTTTKINDVSTEPQNSTPLKWKDVIVIDKTKRPLHSTLSKLKIPFASSSWEVNVQKAQYHTTARRYDSFKHVACLQNRCCIYVKGGEYAECSNAKTYVSASPGDDKKKKIDKGEIAQLLVDNRFTNDEIEKILQTSTRFNPRDWSEIIFVEETMSYAVLRELGIPIVTPADDTYVNKLLYTTKHDFKGFSREEVIVFNDGKAIANPSENMCDEGPGIRCIDQTQHECAPHDCRQCQEELREILGYLDLIDYGTTRRNTVSGGEHLHPSDPSAQRTSSQPDSVSENMFIPRHKLTFADVLIVDVRRNPESIADLFRHCGLHVVDKLNAESVDMTDMFSLSSVMYVKPRMCTGLEKKVVFVVMKKNEKLISSSRSKIIEDPLMLACTRYTSQLVVITTN